MAVGARGSVAGRDQPARAEQVVCLPRRSGVSWGQPRVCGADGVFAQWISVRGGASPRVRSGPSHGEVDGADVGIISACAERTAPCRPDSTPTPDQPRACGAGGRVREHTNLRQGSTPRVRSRSSMARVGGCLCGINPARAEQVVALYCVPALASGTQYSIRSLQSP